MKDVDARKIESKTNIKAIVFKNRKDLSLVKQKALEYLKKGKKKQINILKRFIYKFSKNFFISAKLSRTMEK